jgi:cardiolipin synthase A/B
MLNGRAARLHASGFLCLHYDASVRHILVLACLIVCSCSGNPTDHPYRIESKYAASDPQFQRTMGVLLGPAIVPGNSIETLLNGDQIFPAMLKEIESAQKTITFETYVYWTSVVGDAFAFALAERAKAGVKVHVILDTVGAGEIDGEYIEKMKRAGVEVIMYHPLRWYDVTSAAKLENRTHRKLLVIDGKVGFTGGVGIADEWMGRGQDKDHWRDTHYRVTGPVVAQIQAAFTDNWMEATGRVLHGDDYFPQLAEGGATAAQMFRSSPDGGSESMQLMFLLSVAAAQKNVRIASAYFVPDDLTISELIAARNRGVSVQIIVPGKNIDYKFVRQASRTLWGRLLEAGVEMYEFEPTMFHCKQLIVDDLWVSIGSSNIDNRSFRMNDEANLNVLDKQFATEQIAIFEDDLKRSKRITLQQWRDRPFKEKFIEGFFGIFAPLM